jgi:8-oxo-dGTP diphosphatase
MSDDPRRYPPRPIVAVSAAIVRDGKVFLARRAYGPALGRYTMPGGVVEAGETLHEALVREILEETGLTIEPVALAGHREVVARDADGRIERHFVILCFASRWRGGEPVLNEELSEYHWIEPQRLGEFDTTEGLAEIVEQAVALLSASDARP